MIWFDRTFMKLTNYLQHALSYLIIIFSPNRIQEQYMAEGKKRVYGLIMCSLISSYYAFNALVIDQNNYEFIE